ncbi:hypothetical protein [Bdellovibrio sp. GT3]|uniref:hypothetical protein n=1 Tax=Bdellovibrio sp. GT3 TaxID=3136282 RepID=UPI0030F0FEDE
MKTTIFLLSTSLLLMGCMKEELLPSSALEGGTWKTGCSYSGSNSTYQINTASFSGGNFTQSMTVYGSSSCASSLIKIDNTGTYLVGDKLATSDSIELDMTLGSMNLTPLDATLVTNYNAATYCGYSDWSLGVAKSVAGRTCDTSTMAPVGTVQYDIYYIAPYSIPQLNVVQGTLNFGYFDSTHDGTTPAKRPEATWGNFDYIRQ